MGPRRHLPDGNYIKAHSICEWDRGADGNVLVFESEAQLVQHEAACGERRKRGEYPVGGYTQVPSGQLALAQNINQHNQVEHERTRETVEAEADKLHARHDETRQQVARLTQIVRAQGGKRNC